MGTENHVDDRDDDKCEKYRKERDEWKRAACKYKHERDECKEFLRVALERLGVSVRNLDHLLYDLTHDGKKICEHHDKDCDKDHDKDHGRHCGKDD